MKQEFYDRLKAVIKECEAHPYGSTIEQDFGDGWIGRVSRENLGMWSAEEFDIMFNHRDKATESICKESKLCCFVYCDDNGFMYLAFF